MFFSFALTKRKEPKEPACRQAGSQAKTKLHRAIPPTRPLFWRASAHFKQTEFCPLCTEKNKLKE